MTNKRVPFDFGVCGRYGLRVCRDPHAETRLLQFIYFDASTPATPPGLSRRVLLDSARSEAFVSVFGQVGSIGGVSSAIAWRGARRLDRPFIHLACPRHIARLLQRETKVIQPLGVVWPPLDI